jgi:hypothetical protein
MKKFRYVLPALLFISCTAIQAQVVINEYSCSNWSLNPDNYNGYEDWIELYNPSASAVNLTGYYLSDKPTQPLKWRFPGSVTINPNGFLLIWASGRDEVSGNNYHTNFKLTQTKFPTEQIVLSDAGGNPIDVVSLVRTKKHHAYGRNPDGSATWNHFLIPTPGNSNNIASARQGYSQAPLFSVPPGFFPSAISVTITTQEPNSVIRYTTDGTEPTPASPLYTGPVSIDSTTVLKAICISNAGTVAASFITFGTYFINDYPTLPVVSIAGDELYDLADGDNSLRPQGTIEYFDIHRVRKTAGYGEFNSHGQDSWSNDQRSLDYIMRDEFGYNFALQEQLFNLTPRSEFQRIILRAAGDDNYPAAHNSSNAGSAHLRDAYIHNLVKKGGLDLDVRTATKAIVYLDGIYWGVYDLREIPDDHDFTSYYYNQGKYKLQYIETWGNTWAEYGGTQAIADWDAFHTWAMSHDLTQQANWDYVTSILDVNSLVDYVIVNSLTVCSDWLNYNTGWWRGLDTAGQHRKWGYILWDNDATFGFYINYTGILNKGPNAAPCNVEVITADPKNHIDLLNKLRTNISFNHYYINRYIDLMNTVFGCDNMITTLDSITAVIDPEMNRHAQRWYGTYNEWQNNVQALRNYILQRCAALPALMDSCYNLTGPYPLTVTADPIGTGKVRINSLTVSDFPWSGYYYGGIPVYLNALPDTLNGFYFDRWETGGSTVAPSVYLLNPQLTMTHGDTLVAHFLQQIVHLSEPGNDTFQAAAFPPVFDKETTLAFYLKEKTDLEITLFSTLGQPLILLKGDHLPEGNNSITLDLTGKNIMPGLYLLNIKSKKINKTLRLVYTGQ